MLLNDRRKLASFLQALADRLDIPSHVYEDAILKYEDVGEHLAAEDSNLFAYNPKIYVQGSFRLGTVIQPHGRGDEYDIDLVCQLEIKKESITQKGLKAKVGDRLLVREDLASILESARRCWTLNYSAVAGMPSFHIDVLPSIPNEEGESTGILLTDAELTRWQKSNPLAYAEWFKMRMGVFLQENKSVYAESMGISIDEVPDWRVKTPLQRCIQILKRHRDIHFEMNISAKPVSIILTTLAAHAYQGESDLFDALTGVTGRMHSYIENRNGRWWVQNPVDEGENFADKWNEYPDRRDAFIAWVLKVSEDFSTLAKAETVADGLIILEQSFGWQMMNMVAIDIGVERESLLPTAVTQAPLVPELGNSSHAIPPATQFQLALTPLYTTSIRAGVYLRKKGKRFDSLWAIGDQSVPKGIWLKFTVKTDVPEPHSIRWQVVNTGAEAMRDNQPRGDFYNADHLDAHSRWEPTAYRGTHWVEAFVLNSSGICVSRSGKLLVKVR